MIGMRTYLFLHEAPRYIPELFVLGREVCSLKCHRRLHTLWLVACSLGIAIARHIVLSDDVAIVHISAG